MLNASEYDAQNTVFYLHKKSFRQTHRGLTERNHGMFGENIPVSQQKVLMPSAGEIACKCRCWIEQNGGQ